LLCHLLEVAKSSKAAVELDADAIPAFEPALALAERDAYPGAVDRNREGLDDGLVAFEGVGMAQQAILLGPETSGGLLVFVPEQTAGALLDDLRRGGFDRATVVGRVTGGSDPGHVRVWTSRSGSAQAGRAEQVPVLGREEPARVARDCCGSVRVELEVLQNESGPPSADAAARLGTPVVLPEAGVEFFGHMKAVLEPGALDARTKRLIATALSVATRCDPCVGPNARAAQEAGATLEQVSEAVALGIAFGGAPAAMFYDGKARAGG
jgi:AhpD family alkylhydroperoxidase